MKTGPAGSGDQGWIYGAPGNWRRWTRGTIPQGGVFSIKGSIPDPALTLADQLVAKLKEAGVTVEGKSLSTLGHASAQASASRTLLELPSPPLDAIIKVILKQSFNLYPETLLLHMAKLTGDGSREAGIAAVEKYLRELGVPMEGMHIHDGSGLGRMDKVTALGMARLLSALTREPFFERWKGNMSLLGVDGDLRNREKNGVLREKVRAKTGLINRVRGLCGYLETKSGKRVCFALFANDYAGEWSDVDADYYAVLRILHENL